MTEFRDVLGFPGYRVGDDGSVWSRWERKSFGWRNGIKRILSENWHRMKPTTDKDGYFYVGLWRLGRQHGRRINRLVCAAFNDQPPFPKAQAAHLNGIRTDNRPPNLEWKTCKENHADRERHGKTARGERNGRAKMTLVNVIVIRSLYETGRFTKAHIARIYNISPGHVGKIIRHEVWPFQEQTARRATA